jgi:hypothetical protein
MRSLTRIPTHIRAAHRLKQKHHQHDQPVTLERLMRARAAIAYAMTLDGAVYAPYFERLEREIAAMRTADDVMARARRCLEEIKQQPPPQLPYQPTP